MRRPAITHRFCLVEETIITPFGGGIVHTYQEFAGLFVYGTAAKRGRIYHIAFEIICMIHRVDAHWCTCARIILERFADNIASAIECALQAAICAQTQESRFAD